MRCRRPTHYTAAAAGLCRRARQIGRPFRLISFHPPFVAATSDQAAPAATAGSRIAPALTGHRLQWGPTRVGPPTAVSKTHSLPDLTNTFLSVSWPVGELACR